MALKKKREAESRKCEDASQIREWVLESLFDSPIIRKLKKSWAIARDEYSNIQYLIYVIGLGAAFDLTGLARTQII